MGPCQRQGMFIEWSNYKHIISKYQIEDNNLSLHELWIEIIKAVDPKFEFCDQSPDYLAGRIDQILASQIKDN